MARLPRIVARAGWGMADQAASSLTNFAMGIVVARTYGAADLGVYGLVFTTYLVALNVARASTIEPLLIRFSNTDGATWRDATERMSGLSLIVGVGSGAICLAFGVVVGGTLGACFAALGVALPGLLVQDAWRFAFISNGRPRDAFLNDAAWGLLLLPVVVLLVRADQPGIASLVLAWGLTGTLAALLGIAQAGLRPRPGGARAWITAHGDLGRPLTAQAIISLGAGQFSAYGIAIVAGLAAAGTLRAAQLLMGPAVFVTQALQLVAVPEARRLLARSPAALVRALVVYAFAVSALLFACGLFFVLLPDQAGTALIRQNWEPAKGVMLAVAFSWVTEWVRVAGALGLRVLAQGNRLLVVGAIGSAASLAGAVGGAAIGGAFGGAVGTGLGTAVGAVATWWHFRSALAGLGTPAVAGMRASGSATVL